MHRCRHDLAIDILTLCQQRPYYFAEISRTLGLKYPTMNRAVRQLVYRYSLIPLNPDGTPAFDTNNRANDGKIFIYDTRHYPYFITKVGEMYLRQLQTLNNLDQLEARFLTEDYERFSSLTVGADSILIKPNRFVKSKARIVPKKEPKKPKSTPAMTMTDEEFEQLRHE